MGITQVLSAPPANGLLKLYWRSRPFQTNSVETDRNCVNHAAGKLGISPVLSAPLADRLLKLLTEADSGPVAPVASSASTAAAAGATADTTPAAGTTAAPGVASASDAAAAEVSAAEADTIGGAPAGLVSGTAGGGTGDVTGQPAAGQALASATGQAATWPPLGDVAALFSTLGKLTCLYCFVLMHAVQAVQHELKLAVFSD